MLTRAYTKAVLSKLVPCTMHLIACRTPEWEGKLITILLASVPSDFVADHEFPKPYLIFSEFNQGSPGCGRRWAWSSRWWRSEWITHLLEIKWHSVQGGGRGRSLLCPQLPRWALLSWGALHQVSLPFHITSILKKVLGFSFVLFQLFIQGVFLTGTPPKSSKYKKVNLG